MRIPSVAPVKTNGELIAGYVQPLWIRDDDLVLDATYGKGNFWTYYLPSRLIKHDKFVLDGVDCRKLPEETSSIDIVVLDLPYTSKGGRKTSGIKKFDAAYGLKRAPHTSAGVHKVIYYGMKEARRVLVNDGLLIVKTSDYISGGKYYPGHFNVVRDALALGFVLEDEFVHYRGKPGPQPKKNLDGTTRIQAHSHRAHSFLCVFLKP